METLSYKIESFEGPMDLLLHLISKHKVRIEDVPIMDLINQYLDYMKKLKEENLGASERLNGDGSAILEVTHEELTGGDMIVRTVRTAVNEQRACTADTLAAVVVEDERLLT